jgi:TusA-related sulfurtransferase
LLRAKTALKEMQIGEVLKVLATDPSAKGDFDAMLSFLPHELLAYQAGDAAQSPRTDIFIIRKG